MAIIVLKQSFVMTALRTAVAPVTPIAQAQVWLPFAAMAKSARKPNSVMMATRMLAVAVMPIVRQWEQVQPAVMVRFVLS